MTKEQYIGWIYPSIKDIDMDKVFIIAQTALESGWGSKAIGNNISGITIGSNWTGKKKLVYTTEYFSTPNVKFKSGEKVISVTRLKDNQYQYKVYRWFRDYDTVGECIKDHIKIFQNDRFKDAWPYRHDRNEFLKRIVDSVGGKYATDPNYVKTMSSMFPSIANILRSLPVS